MTDGLLCQNLSKTLGQAAVLTEVTLRAPRGEITALVGPNGAGKSTLMHCLAGLERPDASDILWDSEPLTQEKQRTFSFLPAHRGLYPNDTVGETITFFANVRHPKRDSDSTVDHLIDRFGLKSVVARRVGELSLGTQQRVQVAAALAGVARCILWDEPFTGLDAEGVGWVTRALRDYADRGMAVLLASRQLDVLEDVCDRVTVIQHGRAVSSPVRHRTGRRMWAATLRDGTSLTAMDGVAVRRRLAGEVANDTVVSLRRHDTTHMREFYDHVTRQSAGRTEGWQCL